VEIDLGALRDNLGLIRRSLGAGVRVCLVVKADAYGHGLVPVSRFALANGADWIGVATVQEGVALRDAGIDAPIAVISPTLPVEADQAVFYRLRVLVESLEAARALAQAACEQGTEATVHLEIDTGLARFGCGVDEAADLACAIAGLEGVRLEGASTHFANSGHDSQLTHAQHAEFQRAVATIRGRGLALEVLHAANSAAAVRYPETRLDMVRVGVSAYGIDAYGLFPGESRPVLTWKARVTAMREVAAGGRVSYGGTWIASRPTRVATLGVGYGDGYPRALSNRGVVWLGRRECPVIGLVNMDQTMVDVTDAPDVSLGDVAVVAGGPIPCARLAALMETTSHEITTRIMSRVPRRFGFPG
jgi:alanine racemase